MFKQFYSDIDELHKLVTSEMRLKVAINHSRDAWAELAKEIRKFAQATAEAYPSTIFLASLFSERAAGASDGKRQNHEGRNKRG